MAQPGRNLHRLDDVLLKAGWITLLAVICGVAGLLLGALAQAPVAEEVRLSDLLRASHLRGHAGVVLAIAACPWVLLAAGYRVRRSERKTLAIWDLLRQNAELRVEDLMANSDFELAEVERAVRFLNNRGLGHYVWDRQEGTIQDGRVRRMTLHVEKCEVCSATLSIEVPVGFREIPRCPYCDDPISVGALESRRREAIERMQAEHRPARPQAEDVAIPFSIPIFLGLLLVFWPAAMAYAFFRYHAARA